MTDETKKCEHFELKWIGSGTNMKTGKRDITYNCSECKKIIEVNPTNFYDGVVDE